MTPLFAFLLVLAFLGALLVLYGIVALADRVPWVHERLAEWMPERGW